MNDIMIQKERIKSLNNNSFQNKKFILYWMQASQRTNYNHALEYSIYLANKYDKPLIVFFGLWDKYPEANLRHYYFMLEGLKEVKRNLENRGIKFIIKKISPEEGVIDLSKDCCLIVADRGYLKIQRYWREKIAKKVRCPLIQVESDIVVPVEFSSNKEEYAASTFRPKINKKINYFLNQIEELKIKKDSLNCNIESLDISNILRICLNLNINHSIKPSPIYNGGFENANKELSFFIKEKIDNYKDEKNDPNSNCISNMSPYLHFGQISPVYIALSIIKSNSPSVDTYLEELIIRRELSINFVFYNNNYNSIEGLPSWAMVSLKKHLMDKREYIYSLEELENAETHDSYWNASQKQMIKTGKMHGYMRMYWGKKIIEWSKKIDDAFNNALFLNNKYELDGRDPNGFTGVSWCFGKHDRPWIERPIFGKIRYMNDNGLKRKFDIEKFVQSI